MIPEPGDIGLCGRLPAFRRARDYRLYDHAGKRYLDFWQLDGHAILGHRAAGVSTVMKGLISRGLAPDLPSQYGARLVRALRGLLPSHPFVSVYGCLDRCLDALSGLCGHGVAVSDIVDPAAGPPESASGAIVAWRPFVPLAAYAQARALVPVLPFCSCGGPWALCLAEDAGAAIPPSEPLSAMVLEGASRAVAALGRHSPDPPRALAEGIASAAWSVLGPYVRPRFGRDRYAEVFEAFLSGGVVLSPRFDTPSILPPVLSEGELAAAVGLFRASRAQ